MAGNHKNMVSVRKTDNNITIIILNEHNLVKQYTYIGMICGVNTVNEETYTQLPMSNFHVINSGN